MNRVLAIGKNIILFLCIVSLGFHFKLNAQTITTIAGTGVLGETGDGGPATLADLSLYYDIAQDSNKNLYLAISTHRIRKVNSGGIITTFAGNGSSGYSGDGGPATSAGFLQAHGITVDRMQNVYIADANNGRVRKVNTAGTITTVAGTGTWGYSGDGGPALLAQVYPRGLATDSIGNLYIAEYDNYIRKVDTAGIITTIAGTGIAGYGGDGGPATAAQLYNPFGIVLDKAGNIYVADWRNHRIRKIDPYGIITTIAGNGTAVHSGDGGPATAAGIYLPCKLDIDDNGNIYVGCEGRRVRKISPSGIITTFAGDGSVGYSGDGGPAYLAQTSACGVALNGPGELYINDFYNSVIRLVHDDTVRFTHGHKQLFNACNGISNTMDTLLTIKDIDSAQALSWSLITPPLHGTAAVSYATAATGLPLSPSGLTYTPTAGYTGTDTFKVRVYDEMLADTTMICVTVYPAPVTGTLSGPDTICTGDTVTLTGAVAGGTWHSSDTAVAKVNTLGAVSAIAAGSNTISYSATTGCGTAVATHTLVVLPASICRLGISSTSSAAIDIYPNPNNGNFTITTSRPAKEIQVTISNLLGQVIQTNTYLSGNNLHIDTPGIYLVRITSGNETVTKRVVVE